MIDARPILALLDLPADDDLGALFSGPTFGEQRLSDAIRAVVKATNAELERMVREMFERFGRDYTEQDIAAVLARPVEVRAFSPEVNRAMRVHGETHTPCGGKFVGEDTAEPAPFCPRCQINIYAARSRGEVS